MVEIIGKNGSNTTRKEIEGNNRGEISNKIIVLNDMIIESAGIIGNRKRRLPR